MLLVSCIQQYFITSITVLTNQVWKLLIALFKVQNTVAFMVQLLKLYKKTEWWKKNLCFFSAVSFIFRFEQNQYDFIDIVKKYLKLLKTNLELLKPILNFLIVNNCEEPVIPYKI